MADETSTGINIKKISIADKNLKNYRIVVADLNLESIDKTLEFNCNREVFVEIFFEPHKIKPLLRIDDVLINYWLADVLQYDHKLEFKISLDFWTKYHKKDVDSRIDYILKIHPNDPLAIDKFVGIYDATDIISRIRKNVP